LSMAKLKQTRRSKARKRLTAEQRKYWAARGLLGVVPQKVIVEFERQLDDYIAWYSAGLRKVLSERKSASQQRGPTARGAARRARRP